MANNNHREQVSGLVDDEIGGSQGRFLLSRLSHDDELRACWRRYHLYGEVLRGSRTSRFDLTGAVAAAIAEEPTPQVRHWAATAWLKPVAGVAVAATVAVAAFTGLYQSPAADTPAPIATTDTPAPFDASPSLPQQASVASATTGAERDPWASTRLQSYVLRHNEATANRGQGLVPYIYMVSAPRTTDDGETNGSGEQQAATVK